MKYNFKKSFVLLIAVCGLLLTACGAGNNNSDGTEGKKVLNAGTEATFAPFEFMDKGEISGFDIDLINAVAEEAGYEINIENTGFDAMLVSLDQKQIDVGIAAITIDEKRKKAYDFSDPYFESGSMIAFKEGTDINGAADLKGKKIGVQNATTGQFSAEAVVGENSPDISKYETAALMFQALQSDNVDAVVTDIDVALEYVKNNPDSKLKTVVDDSFETEYYGIAFQKGSEYRDDFNKALNTIFDNGKYEEIYKKWFNDEEPNIDALKNAAKE